MPIIEASAAAAAHSLAITREASRRWFTAGAASGAIDANA
jgi:hypothetical protein